MIRDRIRNWLGIPQLEQRHADTLRLADALRQIVIAQQSVLQRWSTGSETLRSLEARHAKKQQASEVIPN